MLPSHADKIRYDFGLFDWKLKRWDLICGMATLITRRSLCPVPAGWRDASTRNLSNSSRPDPLLLLIGFCLEGHCTVKINPVPFSKQASESQRLYAHSRIHGWQCNGGWDSLLRDALLSLGNSNYRFGRWRISHPPSNFQFPISFPPRAIIRGCMISPPTYIPLPPMSLLLCRPPSRSITVTLFTPIYRTRCQIAQLSLTLSADEVNQTLLREREGSQLRCTRVQAFVRTRRWRRWILGHWPSGQSCFMKRVKNPWMVNPIWVFKTSIPPQRLFWLVCYITVHANSLKSN